MPGERIQRHYVQKDKEKFMLRDTPFFLIPLFKMTIQINFCIIHGLKIKIQLYVIRHKAPQQERNLVMLFWLSQVT